MDQGPAVAERATPCPKRPVCSTSRPLGGVPTRWKWRRRPAAPATTGNGRQQQAPAATFDAQSFTGIDRRAGLSKGLVALKWVYLRKEAASPLRQATCTAASSTSIPSRFPCLAPPYWKSHHESHRHNGCSLYRGFRHSLSMAPHGTPNGCLRNYTRRKVRGVVLVPWCVVYRWVQVQGLCVKVFVSSLTVVRSSWHAHLMGVTTAPARRIVRPPSSPSCL